MTYENIVQSLPMYIIIKEKRGKRKEFIHNDERLNQIDIVASSLRITMKEVR